MMEQILKIIISVAGGTVAYLFGGWSILLTSLLVLNVFDYVTGCAANWGDISSKKGYRGLVKKGFMWVLVMTANIIYAVLKYLGYDSGQIVPNAVVVGFIINEVVSLLENAGKMGININPFFKNALAIFKEYSKGGK